jgi:beta-N-acetylhexosaminidase
VVGGVIAFGGGGGGDDEEALALKKLIGQTVITRLAEETPTPALLQRARKGQIGGVIVAPRQATADEQALQQGLSQLQAAAAEGDNPPLLVMIDQEGGDIRRLPGPPDVSPPDLGSDGDPEAARAQGEQTGAYLKPLGVDVDLAPVLDVELSQTADTIASRTFGEDPALVTGLGVAFIEGLQSQQVAATAKHFPGLGPATINTDFSPVTVVATQEEFDAALEPFSAAVEAGVDLVMMSSAAYPSLAGAAPGQGRVTPAVFAEPIVQGMLRQQLGFDGVVITDDLESIAIQELTEGDVAGVSALGAGCDLLLWARSERASVRGFNAIVRASKRETLTRDRLQQSYDRIVALKRALAAED